ncbi:large T-antigen [Bat mastadenovirus]|uniref:E1B 55 kDa protein n=1 Tax=Bat mastadenovirus TaxID=740971 RepID=A0A3G9EWM4_9ADEN|nr:large T-antigen [Bat mastadenovirus]BBE29301.1 large T-antigen [Bat mastadenovirus]
MEQNAAVEASNGGAGERGRGRQGGGRRRFRGRNSCGAVWDRHWGQRRGSPGIVTSSLDPLHALHGIEFDHSVDSNSMGTVAFETVEANEQVNGPTDNVNFENIIPYRVKPGDDLALAIKTHAKITLDTSAEYVISETIKITGACYIIGNAAVIKSSIVGMPLFEVLNADSIPCIGFMERVCFSNLIFQCTGGDMAVCCCSHRNVMFHGCVFSGPHMLCLDLRAGGEVRGCQFFGAVCAIRSRGLYSVRVKNNTFEKCVFGVVTGSRSSFSHCLFRDCTCSLRLGGQGSITHCQFIVTAVEEAPMNLQLCTCEGNGAHVAALGNLHIASHRDSPWPKFVNNVFLRMRVYLGRRAGVFSPKYCMFGMSVIAAPRGVAQRVYMFSVYDSSCAIMQLSPMDELTAERLCTCGGRHCTPRMRATYVTDTRIDREVNSLDTAEFSSSDDEY